ncbi:hypothetical protein G6O69_24455 [Pseudenhygromyxa sp. WMMC2535]|uniref:hypothetical protein n=1 Tax=Pseudenhygromyxa sp. WMMC2535 TaxID=2712867 RepID=UPI0015557E3B|nr:hypothetical protein [Pseudenhygromyxa sp. WMMC2535]NVB41015.1 hypothetical protein [Pseudenhygromyxa sp. WMMC2535]
MSISQLMLSSLLAFAEPPAGYAEAVDELEAAAEQAKRSTSAATIDRLEQAVEGVERFPMELAIDTKGHEQRAFAQLSLARLYLTQGDEGAAGRVMDDAIFGIGIAPLPIERFGPTLGDFYERRLAALEALGQATLAVDCKVACGIYVDGNAIMGDEVSLYLGPHLVHVTSNEGDPLTRELVLTLDGARIEYGQGFASAGDDSLAHGELSATQDTRLAWGKMERPIPRWKLAGVGVSGGVFLASIGVGLGFGMAVRANGSVHEELITAAEESLTDQKPSNDIDPNSKGDLCALARAEPSPDDSGAVTNAEVTEVCNKADVYASVGSAMMLIVAPIAAVSTITFGLLLNTHRVPKTTAKALRRHQPGLVVAPRRDGGVFVTGGFRF